MRTFACTCGAKIFFENTRCLTCGFELGFLPDASNLARLESKGNGQFQTANGEYRKCSNYVMEGVCNWMVPAASQNPLCQACQLNHVIPDLSLPENRELWAEVERAKRRLVYGLNRLKLPIHSKVEDPENGLAFDIKADVGKTRVLTGHDDGLITLNLAEADAAQREQVRVAMRERYRTMLGHFRHEIGHYFWDRLVRDSPAIEEFRKLFGDERADYGAALKRHYAGRPDPGYAAIYISTYAAAHPWEDFAETFAHYLHMSDTLETAQHFGFAAIDVSLAGSERRDFEKLIAEWTDLTVALNALNRSMGLLDAYPFAISPRVNDKLEYVFRLLSRA